MAMILTIPLGHVKHRDYLLAVRENLTYRRSLRSTAAHRRGQVGPCAASVAIALKAAEDSEGAKDHEERYGTVE